MTYSSPYRQQKPLSSRIKVEQPLEQQKGIKQKKTKINPEPLPSFMNPVNTKGHTDGVEEGSIADVKNYLSSVGDTSPMSGAELHLAQMYSQGCDEALDAL